jgi:hypothetical protein
MTKFKSIREQLKNKLPHEPVAAQGHMETLRNQLRNYESGKYDNTKLGPKILESLTWIEGARAKS